MAWDATQPTPTTKIRTLSTVIPANFAAIETADSTFKPRALNFTDRTAAALPNDPTAIADTVILYSKQDGVSNPQLYAIDPSSTVKQLTGGSQTEAASGHILLPNGIKINWGTFITDSTAIDTNVLFESAFTIAVYSITFSIVNSGAISYITTGSPSKTGFTARGPINISNYYMAIGK